MAGRSGFGNTRKLPSGRWQARYTGPDALVYVGPTTFQTKGDAQAWLAERATASSRIEQWSSPDDRAIRQPPPLRLGAREPSPSTRSSGWRVVSPRRARPCVQPRGRATATRWTSTSSPGSILPLDEITRAAIRAWRGQFSAAGHDAAGAKAYSLLKAILQTAEDDGLIPLNPCRLKGAGHSAKNRESVALTPMSWQHSSKPCQRSGAPSPLYPAGAAYESPSQPACDAPTST